MKFLNYLMLEAVDYDTYRVSEMEKFVLVNSYISGDDGVPLETLTTADLKESEKVSQTVDQLTKLKMLDEKNNMFIVTDNGKKALRRASILDDMDEPIQVNFEKYKL
jgi:hypothetical protein